MFGRVKQSEASRVQFSKRDIRLFRNAKDFGWMTKENKELAKQADGEGGQPRGGKPKKFVDEVLLLSAVNKYNLSVPSCEVIFRVSESTIK